MLMTIAVSFHPYYIQTAARSAAAPVASKAASAFGLVAASTVAVAFSYNTPAVSCDALPVHGVAGTNQERVS